MIDIIIKSHHVEITKSINDYLQKKFDKINQFFDHITEVHVDLDVETFSKENDRQIVSITVFVPGSVLIAKESTEDLYASIDAVLDKISRRLKKHKEKTRLKNRQQAKKTKRTIQAVSIESNNGTKSSSLDFSNYYKPKPLYPEDAALILEGADQQFLVFRNATNEKINVIFVTDDGNFGLIEP